MILYYGSNIEDPDTGLYYQSPVYVFDFLKDEFNAAGISGCTPVP